MDKPTGGLELLTILTANDSRAAVVDATHLAECNDDGLWLIDLTDMSRTPLSSDYFLGVGPAGGGDVFAVKRLSTYNCEMLRVSPDGRTESMFINLGAGYWDQIKDLLVEINYPPANVN